MKIIGSKKQNNEFNFNKKEELLIYKSLWKKKKSKKIDTEHQFCHYKDWKNYVMNRYKEVDLIEFKRFLNQGKRENATNVQLYNVLYVAVFSAIVTKLFDIVEKDILVTIIVIVGIVAYLGMKVFDFHCKESFYEDYIEIIDELIANAKKSDRDKRKNFQGKNFDTPRGISCKRVSKKMTIFRC